MDYYASQRKRSMIVLCAILTIAILAFGIPLIVFASQGSTDGVQGMAVPLALIVLCFGFFMIMVMCSRMRTDYRPRPIVGPDAPPHEQATAAGWMAATTPMYAPQPQLQQMPPGYMYNIAPLLRDHIHRLSIHRNNQCNQCNNHTHYTGIIENPKQNYSVI
jgi:hypothetical protein